MPVMSERNKLLRVSTFEAEASFDFVRLCLGITASVNLLFGTRALSSGGTLAVRCEAGVCGQQNVEHDLRDDYTYVCMHARMQCTHKRSSCSYFGSWSGVLGRAVAHMS